MKDRICKIKQYLNYTLMIINQNILAIIRTFLNLQKNYKKLYTHRSSHLRCSIKKGILKNFVNFTEKHLCLSLLACKFIKKEALVQVLSYEICEIFKNISFIQHFRTTAFNTKQTSTVVTTEFLRKNTFQMN